MPVNKGLTFSMPPMMYEPASLQAKPLHQTHSPSPFGERAGERGSKQQTVFERN
jgi:hypothetical protein